MTPRARQYFWGTTRTIELRPGKKIEVILGGMQLADGTVDERVLTVCDDAELLTKDSIATVEARRLAAALLEAADEAGNAAGVSCG